eukprot:g46732.t1
MKYWVLFLQFTFALTLTVEQVKVGHAVRDVGGGFKMDGNWKVRLVDACRVQMVRELIPETAFGLPDIEETTAGAMDAIDQ